MLFLLFFGLLFGRFLYNNYGNVLWPFWVFMVGYIFLWGKFGSKSWPPRLFLFGMIFILELKNNIISNSFKHLLTILSPDIAYWIDPSCYVEEGIQHKVPSFLLKYSGLSFIQSFSFNYPFFGYTLPELILLIFCIFTILGLLIAVIHQEQFSQIVVNLVNWSGPKGKVISLFLAFPIGLPKWIASLFRHKGWNSGIRVALIPLTLVLLVFGFYSFILYWIFIFLPIRFFFFLIGMDMNSLKVYGRDEDN